MLTYYTLLFVTECTVKDIRGKESEHKWSRLETGFRLAFYIGDRKFECSIGGKDLLLLPSETGSVVIELLSGAPFEKKLKVGDEFLLGVEGPVIDELAHGKITKMLQHCKYEVEDL